MKQKEVFLNGRGDEYYVRNRGDDREDYMRNEDLANMIISLPFADKKEVELLEVGCGKGERLKKN